MIAGYNFLFVYFTFLTQLDPVLAHSKAGEQAAARDIVAFSRTILVFPHGHNEVLDSAELPLPVAIRIPAPFEH